MSDTASKKNTSRFSTKVENYVKYRPHYPIEVISYLRDTIGLSPEWTVADIGSGTGIFSELLLSNRNVVYAVEPNAEMRQHAEKVFKDKSNFHSHGTTAENTGLDSGSVDMITAAQAFHWFDQEKVRVEFQRILKQEGQVVLLWNEWQVSRNAFHQDFEAFIQRFGTDYDRVRHNLTSEREKIETFFSPQACKFKSFNNSQTLDFKGLLGRILSCSYIPDEEDPRFESIKDELRILFDRHQEKGAVELFYRTLLFHGHLA